MTTSRANNDHILQYTNAWTCLEPELKGISWTSVGENYSAIIAKGQQDVVMNSLNAIKEVKCSIESEGNYLKVVIPKVCAVNKLQNDELNAALLGCVVYLKNFFKLLSKEQIIKLEANKSLITVNLHATIFNSTYHVISPAEIESEGFPFLTCAVLADQNSNSQLEKNLADFGFNRLGTGMVRRRAAEPGFKNYEGYYAISSVKELAGITKKYFPTAQQH